MDLTHLFQKLAVLFLGSVFFGFIYVFVFGKQLGVDKNIANFLKITFIMFILFVIGNVILPINNGTYK